MTESRAVEAMEAARRTVRELIAGGVRIVVLCPGSRSAPLAYALAEVEASGDVEIVVRIDERSAGFVALGAALAGERPAAVVTTSGTAVGNLMPAVMEAHHAAVSLVVVSADRPEELHGTGANQTTEQLDIYGEHVRFAVSVAAGDDPSRSVRTAVDVARGLAGELPPGPVQVNLCLRDPLTPDAGWDPGKHEGGEFGFVWEDNDVVVAEPAEAQPQRRTVILAGHTAGPIAEAFARAHGLPLFAEPSSNARFGTNAVGPYRLLLDTEPGRSIERVVLFGRPTLSRPVTALLARDDVETALYQPEPVAWFEPGRRREIPIDNLEDLSTFAGIGVDGWLEAWQQSGSTASKALIEVINRAPLNGPAIASRVWAADPRQPLVLGSSNGIRDVDLAGDPAVDRRSRVFANRGLAGIDGTISTATGVWFGSGRAATTVFLGDLTFLHDVGGLWREIKRVEPTLRIIVLNDHGGAIFDLLEHGALREEPSSNASEAVERLFATPQFVDLESIATAYRVGYTKVTTLAELDAALGQEQHGTEIIEVVTDRQQLRDLHDRIRQAVSQAVIESRSDA